MGDLVVRGVSSLIMVAIAAVALWAGGLWFAAFAIVVGAGVLWEWWQLARRIANTPLPRLLWMVGGVIYVGSAVAILVILRFVVDSNQIGLIACSAIVAITVVIDVSAYCVGRLVGGPKIAPSISPSKTWAGLAGAMAGAAALLIAATVVPSVMGDVPLTPMAFFAPALAGVILAIVGQAGDFFESWMKRRAGVKDSGNLIPGHGGLFDRIDGLLAVTIVAGSGLLSLLAYARGMWS